MGRTWRGIGWDMGRDMGWDIWGGIRGGIWGGTYGMRRGMVWDAGTGCSAGRAQGAGAPPSVSVPPEGQHKSADLHQDFHQGHQPGSPRRLLQVMSSSVCDSGSAAASLCALSPQRLYVTM